MRWYAGLVREAARPPSYVVERMSDLSKAAKLARISPSNTRSLLSSISEQLTKQGDEGYAKMADEAARVVLDSPNKAIEIIAVIMKSMQADKDDYESERKPWKKIKIK